MMTRQKKGNISIIVMFILALVSLLALLSAGHVRHIVNAANGLREYYTSYYIAKAGIETAIVAVDNYGIGFEENIGGTGTISDNFDCTNCYFSGIIISRTHYVNGVDSLLTNSENERECVSNNAITLGAQETYSIPLFYDASKRLEDNSWTSILNQNLDIEIENIGDNENYAISISLEEGTTSHINRHKLSITGTLGDITINKFLHDLNITHINSGEVIGNNQELIYNYGNETSIILPISKTFDEFNNYLLITNNSSISNPLLAEFCIKINNSKSELTRGFTSVSSIGRYKSSSIGLGARINTQLPDFLFSTFIQR